MKVIENICKFIIAVFIIFLFVAITMSIIDTNIKVNKIYNKICTEEKIDSMFGLIKVNGELFDEDDYNQMD